MGICKTNFFQRLARSSIPLWLKTGFSRRARTGDHLSLSESLQRYKFLVETLPQIVWFAKPDGEIDYFNRRWVEYTGVDVEEAKKTGWEKALHPDDLARSQKCWNHSLTTGDKYEIEYRLRREDGTYRWHWGRAFAMRNEQGRIIHWVGSSTDIEEQKQAHAILEERVSEHTRELATSRQELETILNSSLDGVMVLKSIRDEAGTIRDFRFMMFNPAAEKLFRTVAPEMLGHTLLEKVATAATDGLFERYVRIVETNENQDFEYLSTIHLPESWYRIAGVRLADGLVVIYTDITARKQHEQQLEEAKEKAELADRAKSDFLATMSHEIRTPMNGVMGLTGLLLDTALDTEQRSLAETIRTSGESLLNLINDILDFSKIEAGKLSFEELDFDLRKVVEDTMEICAAPANAKGIELIGGVEPGVITKLRGDPGRVQQLLTNLVANAVKFTQSGEVVMRVMSELETERGVVVHVEISDTGIGIKPEIQKQLFEPFVQGESSTTRRFGGTGLGLAICKRLAESMNGSIGVRSKPGEGSTFWTTLRFIRQADALKNLDRDPPPEFIDKRVLIVDDNAASCKSLRNEIQALGMRGVIARSGDGALEILRDAVKAYAPFPVAILDLQMPGTDGLAVAGKIRALPELSATRLMLLTPYGKTIPRDDLKNAGIDIACAKPVRQSTLFDCLMRMLSPGIETTETEAAKSFNRLDTTTTTRRLERILLAEDNAVNQRVAFGNLRKLGFEADLAQNGLEVLHALEEKTYDIILMDCQMPELDGYQATREIRKREKKGRRTWIIAMTANVMVGDREKCLAAGMDDYVSKPLRREELRAAMERCLVQPAHAQTANASIHGLDENDDIFAELIELFEESAPQSIAGMKRALEQGKAADLFFAAHTLKGSCGNLGDFPLYDICARIEASARDGQLEGMSPLVIDAEKELGEMISALKSHRIS